MDIRELVKSAKAGNKNDCQEILKMFTPLILKKVSTVYISGFDREDLIQCGYKYILQAIKKYDVTKSTGFAGYVKSAIYNNYNDMIRKKAKERFNLSLERCTDSGTEFMDFLVSDYDIENEIVKREMIKELKEALLKLPKCDQDFILGVSEKLGLKKYCESTGKNYSTCSKKKQRIIKKLRQSFHVESKSH